MKNTHDITRDFEQALCEYTGAPYAVAVTSCTMALLLAVRWQLHARRMRWFEDMEELVSQTTVPQRLVVTIPKRTYVSVPQAIRHAGAAVEFDDREWLGYYQLKPLPVFDCARWLSSNMYDADPPWRHDGGYDGNALCVSFHSSKILADTQGGAILHDDPQADAWYRRARFDGRAEGVPPNQDNFTMLGYHCYLSPDVAARLLWRMASLPAHNDALPNDAYPDLSQFNWNEMT